jgi:hypothetical protein
MFRLPEQKIELSERSRAEAPACIHPVIDAALRRCAAPLLGCCAGPALIPASRCCEARPVRSPRKAGASRTALPFPPWRLPGGSVKPRLSIVRAQITGSSRPGFQRDMVCLQTALHVLQFRVAKPRTWVWHYGAAGSDLTPACGHQRSPATAGLFLQRIEQMAVYNDLLIALARHARTASPHAPKHDVLCHQHPARQGTASAAAAEMAGGRATFARPALQRHNVAAGESKRGRDSKVTP